MKRGVSLGNRSQCQQVNFGVTLSTSPRLGDYTNLSYVALAVRVSSWPGAPIVPQSQWPLVHLQVSGDRVGFRRLTYYSTCCVVKSP